MRTNALDRSSNINRRSRFIAVTALALAGVWGAGVAQARPEIQIPVPAFLPQPPVLHLPHATVRPVPVYATPAPVYAYPQDHRHYRGEYRGEYRSEYRGEHRGGYQQPTRWDRDGDGVPNRHDRVYNPRWDRDGDGVPNRYDRHPRSGYGR